MGATRGLQAEVAAPLCCDSAQSLQTQRRCCSCGMSRGGGDGGANSFQSAAKGAAQGGELRWGSGGWDLGLGRGGDLWCPMVGLRWEVVLPGEAVERKHPKGAVVQGSSSGLPYGGDGAAVTAGQLLCGRRKAKGGRASLLHRCQPCSGAAVG